MSWQTTDNISVGEKYGPAMGITTQAEADAYFERCVRHWMYHNGTLDRAAAEQAERANLAYYAGYFDDATRLRVEALFRCVHPIFGPATTPITLDEAYRLGREGGRRA